jgi:dTDP-4-amino-4,6-dideoxygalactose transaminase
MTANNIGVGVHYLSIPEHPFYQETYGWKPEDYPNATRIGRQTVSLPLSAKMNDEDVEDVIEAVKRSGVGCRVSGNDKDKSKNEDIRQNAKLQV